MFGRDLRAAEHRRHMPLPQNPGYTFERIGSAPRVADLSGWEAGDLAFLHQEALDSGDNAKAQEIEQEADRRGINLDDAYGDLDEDFLASRVAFRKEARPSERDLLSIVKSIAVSVGFSNARSMKMYDGSYFASLGQDYELFITPTGRGNGYDWRVERKGSGVVREGYGMTSREIIEDIRGSGVVASRTAGKCPECDGMGRETYETDTGSLSTQTCTACGGTGVTASRKQASGMFQWNHTVKSYGDSWADMSNTKDKVNFTIDHYEDEGWEDEPGGYVWNILDHETGQVANSEETEGTPPYSSFEEAEASLEAWVNSNNYLTASRRKQASSYKQEQIIDAYYAGEFGNRVKSIEFVDNPSLVNKQVYLHIRARGKQKIFVPWNGEWYGAGGSGNGLRDLKRYLENWGKHSSRRTAFLDGFEIPEPRHRVAGWDWDDHLNGFVAAEAAREFTCACGDDIPAPGYTDCRCGKRWNAYTIQANGSKKMIAREVPVRDGVVMASRTASRKQAADYSNYSYDQLVDARDILRQQYADWEIDQSEYRDTLAEIEAEAESRGLTLASRKGRVAARRTASERDQVLEDWIAFLEKKGLPRNTGTWEPEASDFDSSGYSGEAMEFLYEWSSGKMGSRKTAADASYEGWTARIIYDEDDFEYAETTTPSGEQADSIYPMDGSHFEGGELREALEELAREWGDDAYSGTYQYNSRRKQANVTWYPAPNNSLTTYDGPDPFGTVIPIGTVSENHGQYRWNVDDGADFFESGSESSLQAAQSAVEEALSRAPSPPAGGGGGFGGDELEQFLNWRTDMGKMNENAVSDQELLQDLNEYNPPFSSQEVIKQELGLF